MSQNFELAAQFRGRLPHSTCGIATAIKNVRFVNNSGKMPPDGLFNFTTSYSEGASMLSIATAVLATSIVAGQVESHSPTYKELKVLQPLVGNWVYEGKLKDDLVGLKPGATVRFEYSFRWILKRAVLRWQWSISSGDEVVVQGLEHLGWNAKKGKIVSVMFSSTGSMDTSEWSVGDKSFTSHFSGVQANGTKFGGDVILKVPDSKKLTWQAVDYSVGDAAPVATAEYQFSRK